MALIIFGAACGEERRPSSGPQRARDAADILDAAASDGAEPDAGVAPDASAGDAASREPVWREMSTTNAPMARSSHSAVWTGTAMIVFGGTNGTIELGDGATYDPAADRWTPLPSPGAPSPRWGHSAVWTGTEMIVWGGRDWQLNERNDGAIYDPGLQAWRPISTINAPVARMRHVAYWSGSEMIVWGGLNNALGRDDGAAYDPAQDTWRPLAASADFEGRTTDSWVWTGSELLVFSGLDSSGPLAQVLEDGARYDPMLDQWSLLPSLGAPTARTRPATVWTGLQMIIWGGYGNGDVRVGARYAPADDAWSPMAVTDAPPELNQPFAVWSGTEMLVFGVEYGAGPSAPLIAAGRYDPAADEWHPMSIENAPTASALATVIWTGQEMIIWGGRNVSNDDLDTGARFDPR